MDRRLIHQRRPNSSYYMLSPIITDVRVTQAEYNRNIQSPFAHIDPDVLTSKRMHSFKLQAKRGRQRAVLNARGENLYRCAMQFKEGAT
jgi:hypothetical protein